MTHLPRTLAAAATGTALLAIGAASFLLPSSSSPGTAIASGHHPELSVVTSYKTDSGWDETGAEIVAYDAGRMYVVNGDRGVVEVVDISDPANPQFLFDLDTAPFGADVTSVAVRKGLIVAAVPASPKTEPGRAVFFDKDGDVLASVETGALPDMVTFTPNGAWALVANEGEPSDDYDVDPEGSVTIIHVPTTLAAAKRGKKLPPIAVRHVTFEAFNEGGPRHDELPEGIRIFGPNATVAQDLEPEYIAFSRNNRKAYVTLQENNAVAVIDVQRGEVDSIFALGFKDYSLPGNELDPSDRDDEISIASWPVLGMYNPDALASFTVRGKTYLVTANEGDARDYDGYSEEERLGGLIEDIAPLCADVFPNAAELEENENLGRLRVTSANGLRTEGANAPCYEEIYAYGARSFSIWTADGEQVFDSGSQFETIIAAANPDFFNSNHTENTFESRSDDKGPEPEGVTTAQVDGRTYAFIALERIGGVMVYDVTNPATPEFIQYINNRDFTADPTGPDAGAEGLAFVEAKNSPNGTGLLLVANEVSGTVSIFQFD